MATDSNRIKELITRQDKPKTREEEFLIEFYDKALAGDLLFELVMEKEELFSQLNQEDLRLMMYGYSLGQKHFDERTIGFDLEINKPSGNDGLH